jgi:hypothetical protein
MYVQAWKDTFILKLGLAKKEGIYRLFNDSVSAKSRDN